MQGSRGVGACGCVTLREGSVPSACRNRLAKLRPAKCARARSNPCKFLFSFSFAFSVGGGLG